MADPLTVALAAISLATALKDIIELARNLNDSFKKPARNMQKAESLAAETLAIVQDLKKFYDGHKEILDNAQDMQDAVLRLLKEMEMVHQKCKPLLQVYSASNGTMRTWIKRKIGPWWKRDSLEESIQNVRDGANKCRSDFMMFALMRIEAATAQVEASTAQIQATAIQIQATTIEIRAAITNEFARPHLQPSNLQVSDDNVLAFLGSTPVILSQLPPHVKLAEHLVYKECITLQVGKIDTLFKTLSSGGLYSVEEPDSFHLGAFRSVVHLKPSTEEEMEGLRIDVFAQIAKIRGSLNDKHDGQSIQGGAHAMSALSFFLNNLKMYEESLSIARFAVDLYGTLNKKNENVYGPRFAHALARMSYSSVDTGDLVQAYKAITEAVTLGRRLVTANPTFEAQIQLVNLISYSAFVARRNGDFQNAVRDAKDAVQSYERLVGRPTSLLQTLVVNVTNGRNGSTIMTMEETWVYDFAEALKELHYGLSSITIEEESVSAGIHAIDLYSALEQRHNHSSNFSRSIADLCYSLASNKYRNIIQVDQSLSYVEESTLQYEKMFRRTGVVPRNLPRSLVRQAEILSSLERFEEAYAVCQKLKQIVQQHMVEDHQLRSKSLLQLLQTLYYSRRYMDAALVGEQLLATYRSLLSNWDLFIAYSYTSFAFEESGNISKATQIGESAVSYWRVLAFHDSTNVKFLAGSLDNLANYLRLAAEHGGAFSKGHEAMKLYSRLIETDTNVLEYYILTLQLNMRIAEEAKMEIKSLERSREVIQYSRALVKQFPERQIFLIRLILDHAKLLDNADQLVESIAAIEEILIWFDDHPAQDEDLAGLHTDTLLYSGRLLYYQGHLDKALRAYDKTIEVGRPFEDAYSEVASNILQAKAQTLMILYLIGQVTPALAKIEDCVTFASEHDLAEEEAYTCSLGNASLVYRSTDDIGKAVSTMRRSIVIDRDQSRTPFSWILSDLLADTGEEEEALTVVNEAIQECEQWQDNHTITIKELYVQAQYCLALRLFANNDLARARELLIEVRIFYQKHSRTRNIWFIKLAIASWALGHLECASGRHEEGISVRNELTDLRKSLRLIFPSLDDLAHVGLKRERDFAAWKILLKKVDVKCGHQDKEEILEAAVISQFESIVVL